jgi:hypothetical protein
MPFTSPLALLAWDFIQADQRVCEWCSAFASTVVAILDALFGDLGLNTDDERQAFAASSLEDYTFLYRDVFEHNGKVRRKFIYSISPSLRLHFS